MEKSPSKRILSIEALRLLACLIVIGVHTTLSGAVAGETSLGHIYLCCLAADGVGIFWMITGCFLFGKKTRKVYENGIRKILIPLLLITLAAIGISRLGLPGWPAENIRAVFESMLHGSNGIAHLSQLWYLYVNLFVLLLYPLLNVLVGWLDRSKTASWIFLGAAFALFAVNDISCNRMMQFGHGWDSGWLPAAIEMICGHILYRTFHERTRKDRGFLFIVLFFLLNLGRAFLHRYRIGIDPAENSILYWFSSIGLLCEASLLLAGMALFPEKKNEQAEGKKAFAFFSQTVYALASYTFLIYLVHLPVMMVLRDMGLQDRLVSLFFSSGYSLGSELLYWIVHIAIVFVISLLISWLVRLCGRLLKLLFRPWRAAHA